MRNMWVLVTSVLPRLFQGYLTLLVSIFSDIKHEDNMKRDLYRIFFSFCLFFFALAQNIVLAATAKQTLSFPNTFGP
jgi:hypothetical protein